ncbi:MAG: polysaccharide biosynthesis protein [Clostridia bacterium]|nr:polysaccharide biosynthesis protein [Clostridia bacterium]
MKFNNRNILLVSFDTGCFALISIVYYILSRFTVDGVDVSDFGLFALNVGILLLLMLMCRFFMGIYFTVWRYTHTPSYLRLILADMVATVLSIGIVYLARIQVSLWLFATIAPLAALMAISARYCYRLRYKKQHQAKAESYSRSSVAIVGAGQMGSYLVNELRNNPNSKYLPVCFIDTDRDKIDKHISGLHVYSPESFAEIVEQFGITEVIVAIASVSGEQLSHFYDFYAKLGCKVKIYDSPNLEDQEDGEKGERIIRQFQIEDLLFRKQISITGSKTAEYYRGKVILVTGGGGSIGSELCRQIAKCEPKKLVIFDIYENNAYEIQQELIRKYGSEFPLEVIIGSVRDRQRLEYIFDLYRPEIVFHAAAHKHVPLMEQSCAEAVKNNVIGTYNTADMAEKYGAKKFILISTDKAVNPTNVMGASKRLCEMVVQCRTDSKTSFAAVRFGNVLGSNGSVIPLFKKQIAEGGPITITDKRIIRYFMLIPEASQLVMQAGAMAKKGELFVLDMGKPVRIYDLAENMIKLSGLIPHVDIEIKEIGLRPGEKLYEELLMKTEDLTKTDNDMIFIEKDHPLTREDMEENLALLQNSVADFEIKGQIDAVKNTIKAIVPTFRDPEEVNVDAEKSEEMKMTVSV